jgi:hypothetical protein
MSAQEEEKIGPTKLLLVKVLLKKPFLKSKASEQICKT